jgi:hypothetical protein
MKFAFSDMNITQIQFAYDAVTSFISLLRTSKFVESNFAHLNDKVNAAQLS